MSIAYASMRHLVEEIKCKTLFITHYPLLASEIARDYPEVSNGHMGFIEDKRPGTLYSPIGFLRAVVLSSNYVTVTHEWGQ